MFRGDKIKKKKSIVIMLFILFFMTIFSASSTVNAGKAYYWLATDGDIDPQSVFVEYSDLWTGQDLEQRIAQFKWYVDRSVSRGGSISDSSPTVGGTKAELSMSGSGNDWQLNIQIYRGGAKKPTAGPEIYQWNIINGMDSHHDCINVVFTNTITGKTSKSITLYNNDVEIVGLPHISEFTCRMWLI
jgi:hypothetical protein